MGIGRPLGRVRWQSPYVAAVVTLVVGVVAGAALLTGASPAASAKAADSDGKVWVCKYVGKPGEDERLKEGKNPIEVSISAAGPVGTTFADAQGRSYVIALSDGSPEPSCPDTPPGPEPTPTCPTEPTKPATTEPTEPETTEPESPTETPTETTTPPSPSPTETTTSPGEEPSGCPTCPTVAPTETSAPATGGTESPTATGSPTAGATSTVSPTEPGAQTTGACPTATGTVSGTETRTAAPSESPTPTPTQTPSETSPTGSAAGLLISPVPAGRHHGPRTATLRMPALDVRAPILDISAPDRVLQPPSDPAAIGRWNGGATLGSSHGRVVLTGHTVHDGYGALNDLDGLVPGEAIVVRTDAGALRYAVDTVRTYSKAALASHSSALFGQHSSSALVLVTCSGWDGASYTSNVVVVARPLVTVSQQPHR